MSANSESDEQGCVVKLRGLPWSATVDEIINFFGNCKVKGGPNGVHMTTSREGRPSGEAYIEFDDVDDVERACQRDRDHMGNRYIEVFKVKKAEMEWMVKRSGTAYDSKGDGCVRLRGLPFGCSKEEIAQFFTGLEIVPNGITLLTDYSGRSSGEAYVQFVNKEVAEKALLKHREKIGHRYIEIFRSSLSEVNGVLGYPNRKIPAGSMGNSGGGGGGGYRPSPYDRGDRYSSGMGRMPPRMSRSFKDFNNFDNRSWNNDNMNNYNLNDWNGCGDNNRGGASNMHCIHMRGLPFKASQMDIADFFKPITPVNIRLLQDNSGRASGEADVEFDSHDDAVRAMSKDKCHMQHRYIELFLNSSPGSNGGGNNNNGNMNGPSMPHYGAVGRRRM